MKSGLDRKDDFDDRRKHLKSLSDEELKKKFWKLTEKIVDPMIELAKKHTSPAIERSVLLRMGFNSLESNKIVDILFKKNLLEHGAGNIILIISRKESIPYIDAGKKIINGYSVENLF